MPDHGSRVHGEVRGSTDTDPVGRSLLLRLEHNAVQGRPEGARAEQGQLREEVRGSGVCQLQHGHWAVHGLQMEPVNLRDGEGCVHVEMQASGADMVWY